MLKMKKRTERKRVDWGAVSQKEDKEREGEDLREEFKSSAVSTDDAVWPWNRTTSE